MVTIEYYQELADEVRNAEDAYIMRIIDRVELFGNLVKRVPRRPRKAPTELIEAYKCNLSEMIFIVNDILSAPYNFTKGSEEEAKVMVFYEALHNLLIKRLKEIDHD